MIMLAPVAKRETQPQFELAPAIKSLEGMLTVDIWCTLVRHVDRFWQVWACLHACRGVSAWRNKAAALAVRREVTTPENYLDHPR